MAIKNLNTWDIYCIYRKVQACSKERGYRLPKDWDNYWENKLSESSKNALINLKNYFNTKWCDISIEKYFEAGFRVFKNLSYNQMLNRKIIKEYIRLDKMKKLNDSISKKAIMESAKFCLTNYTSFNEYCKTKYNITMRQPIKDYMDNNISAYFLVLLIKYNFLNLTSSEKCFTVYINNNFRRISYELDEIEDFTKKIIKKGG